MYDNLFHLGHIGLVLIICFVLYKYFTRNNTYWSKRGINGPKPILLFGTTFADFFGKNKCYLEKEWLRKYGRIYGIYSGRRPKLVVAQPSLIKDIFVRDFNCFVNTDSKRLNVITNKSLGRIDGDDWRRLRPILSPIFSAAKMKQMFPIISECAKRVVNQLSPYAIDGHDFDIKNLVLEFMHRSLCACSAKRNAHSLDIQEFIVNGKRVFNMRLFYEMSMTLLPRIIPGLCVAIFGSTAETGNEFFIDFSRRMLCEMRSNDTNSVHIIDMISKYCQKYSQTPNERIDEEEILGQLWTFFIANAVMTGNTLSSAIYELAMNDDIQQKLYEELYNACDDCGHELTFEQLASLPYLDAVISETLRLHVPALSVSRIASQDYILGDTGIHVDSGIKLEIPIYAMHTCEEFFPKAESFIPERFMAANRHNIIPYSYQPFGDGPRICIATRFAAIQMKVLLSKLVLTYSICRTPGTDTPMKMTKHTAGHSPDRVIIGVAKRQKH